MRWNRGFLNNFIFMLMHFRVFLRGQPYGVGIFIACWYRVDVMRQSCPAKRLTPMGLFAGESVRCFCGFRRRIAHIPLRVYMGVRENTCKQALRLGLLTPPLSTAAYLYFIGKAQAQLFNLFVRIEISLVCLYLKMASTKPQRGLLAKNFVLRHNS